MCDNWNNPTSILLILKEEYIIGMKSRPTQDFYLIDKDKNQKLFNNLISNEYQEYKGFWKDFNDEKSNLKLIGMDISQKTEDEMAVCEEHGFCFISCVKTTIMIR